MNPPRHIGTALGTAARYLVTHPVFVLELVALSLALSWIPGLSRLAELPLRLLLLGAFATWLQDSGRSRLTVTWRRWSPRLRALVLVALFWAGAALAMASLLDGQAWAHVVPTLTGRELADAVWPGGTPVLPVEATVPALLTLGVVVLFGLGGALLEPLAVYRGLGPVAALGTSVHLVVRNLPQVLGALLVPGLAWGGLQRAKAWAWVQEGPAQGLALWRQGGAPAAALVGTALVLFVLDRFCRAWLALTLAGLCLGLGGPAAAPDSATAAQAATAPDAAQPPDADA